MLLLIDGDVFAHRCCRSRQWERIKDIASLEMTEVLKMVEDRHAVVYSSEEDKKYLEESWATFRELVRDVCERFYTDDFMMAIKSPWNYRDDMFPEYKLNRHKDPKKMNQFVPAIRQRAISEMGAVEAVGREADDLLRIWAEQCRLAGTEYVIVSVDKDLDCIPGAHYNPKTHESYVVTEYAAMRFFYQQLLSGDPTDNIPGIPGIGPVKASGLLAGLTTEEEMQEQVVLLYASTFGNDWYDMLLSNGKMLYLQRHEYDFFTLEHWEVAVSLRTAQLDEVKNVSGMLGMVRKKPEEPKPAPAAPPPSGTGHLVIPKKVPK